MQFAMLIYKIMTQAQRDALMADGQFKGAPVDLADGYIHFSAADQVEGTLTKHFAGATDLHLLAVEADGLGDDLKWEVSRGGALFPHLYRALRLDDVVWQKPIPLDDTTNRFAPVWL